MKKLAQQFSENLLSTTSGHETHSSKSVRGYSDTPIPDDILVEIFSRLPRKSIARFGCVSKFLASIFCRHDFTELFLTKSLTRPLFLFIIEANGTLFFYSAPQPQNPDDNSSLVATPYHTSFPEFILCDISSTVCGLVVLQGYWDKKNVQVICNPATGQFLTLPKVLLKEKDLPTKIAGMYIGYDPLGKQFKVLCMTSSHEERLNTHQVLTLESGKRLWRRVERKFHFVKNHLMRGEICIEGVLYFGTDAGQSFMIVCFNIGSEKFSFINTAVDMQVRKYLSTDYLNLFNYKGKLGILHHVGEELVVWAVEDAENHKWSKHNFKLSPCYSKIIRSKWFVGMTSTCEVVSISYHHPSKPFYFSFYNLERKTLTRVNIQGLEGFKHPRIIDAFVDYVENMNFIRRPNPQGDVKKPCLQVPPDGRPM